MKGKCCELRAAVISALSVIKKYVLSVSWGGGEEGGMCKKKSYVQIKGEFFLLFFRTEVWRILRDRQKIRASILVSDINIGSFCKVITYTLFLKMVLHD